MPELRVRSRVTAAMARLQTWVTAVLAVGLSELAWPFVIGGSVGLSLVTIWSKFGRWAHPKYGSGVMVVAFAVLGFFGCGVLVLLLRHRSEAWQRASRTVRRYGIPIVLLPIALVLGEGLERRHEFLVLALACVGAWLMARWTLEWVTADQSASAESTRAAAKWMSRWPTFTLGALIVAYSLVFSILSVRNNLAFNTGRADLGFYVSIFRRSSLGDPLGCTICGGGNHLSGHFDPILVLLSPLYWIYQEAETVLVLQSILLGSAMLPLYLLARHHGLAAGTALIVCACYGLHPALAGVNLFDFHSLALLIPVALWVLWARDTGRVRTYLLLLLLLLSVREDAALVAVFIGADTLLSNRKHSAWLGLGTIVLSALYFVLVKALLMTGADPLNPGTGRGYAYYYKDLIPRGTGTAGLVNSVLTDLEKVLVLITEEPKVLYWLQLLAPVLALPLIARRGRLLLAYGAAFTLLASREFVFSLHFHYSSVVLPFLFYLTVLGFDRAPQLARVLFRGASGLQERKLQRVIAVGMLTATMLTSWRFGGILPNRSFHAGFRPLKRNPKPHHIARDAALKEICRSVPAGASVAANEPDLPHLGRCHAYLVKGKRKKADYLAWSFSKGSKTTRAIQKEIDKGYWEQVGTFWKIHLFKNVFPETKPSSPKKRARQRPKRSKKPSSEKRTKQPAAQKKVRVPPNHAPTRRRSKRNDADSDAASGESSESGER